MTIAKSVALFQSSSSLRVDYIAEINENDDLGELQELMKLLLQQYTALHFILAKASGFIKKKNKRKNKSNKLISQNQ
jgi:hypothetical protein